MADKAAIKAARRVKFEDAWNVIRDELVEYAKNNNMPNDAVQWFHKNLEYNVPGGKLNRGMSVVDTAEIIKGRTLNDKEYLQAAVLGWGVELLQAFFLVSDDLMDSSITRRGQPCYYRVPGIGLISINDAFMLESSIYFLLKKHFRSEPYYVDILDLFHETTFQTELGQLIDLISAPEDHVDLNKFSLEKHSLIVIYKTAFYSFYLPVALAMLMCNIPYTSSTSTPPTPLPSTPNTTTTHSGDHGISHSSSKTTQSILSTLSLTPTLSTPYFQSLQILIPLGEYFQIQDDYLDFSGLPMEIGKVGTDIVDNKCSWVINTALSLCSPAQRALLDKNYGVKPSSAETAQAEAQRAKAREEGRGEGEEQGYLGEHEKRVKALFEELGIRKLYKEYEEGVVKKLNEMIESLPEPKEGEEGLRREVFTSFLGKIYGRKK